MSAIKRLAIDSLVRGTESADQTQTKDTFAFKWKKRESYESEAMDRQIGSWLFERYCDGDPSRLDEWLSRPNQIIVDAGCGAGNAALLFFGERLNRHDYLGIDISSAVDVARQRFQERSIKGDFLQVGISDFAIPPESVDLMFSEGVLHHTDNTRNSLIGLSTKLKKGGLFLFYVYAKKSAIREYSDDLIRAQLSKLSDEEAWTALEALTKFGKSLGEKNVEIEVPEDLDFFGIKAGKYDLQRFFYWHICKLFYRPELTLDEMNHINFDWYRPLNCHRHTVEEVREFCRDAGLLIKHLNVQEAGITVVGEKA